MTDVRKLYILLCGYEVIRKSGCLRGAKPEILLAVPICAYLMETAHGFVLFDAGLDSARLRDPAEAHRLYVNDVFPLPPVVLPEHELLPQLAALGVAPDDVRQIILSHAHSDHTGYLSAFPQAEILIQRIEHDVAFGPEGREAKNFGDYASDSLRWRIVEGDAQVMPGLDLLFTPGHRPGHQSALVVLPSGARKILVGDVVDLLENFDREVIGGATDPVAALASLRRLKALVAETGADLVPLHDPDFVQAARLAPEFYA
jgi:N-acyl homoserine lactone hydrolase